jgi:hypothetical protein
MQLHYLDFDFSDEDNGRGRFDAMASVLPDRVPDEVQGIIEPCTPLKVAYDEGSSEVSLTPAAGPARTTLTLTLSGSPAFCDAFRDRFELGD